jgi:hypothetical protein
MSFGLHCLPVFVSLMVYQCRVRFCCHCDTLLYSLNYSLVIALYTYIIYINYEFIVILMHLLIYVNQECYFIAVRMLFFSLVGMPKVYWLFFTPSSIFFPFRKYAIFSLLLAWLIIRPESDCSVSVILID